MHSRRTFCLATLACLLPLPGAAQQAELARISAYLNGITTLTGRFRQTNPDNTVSEGRFYISRPGLLRFEYEVPQKVVVIADGVWVAVIDPASNQPANRYPLSETPLDILLRDRVDLTREGAIREVARMGDRIRVTARDPDAPENGTLSMIFTQAPIELREWIVIDGAGERTRVELSDIRRGVALERALFSIEAAELVERGPER